MKKNGNTAVPRAFIKLRCTKRKSEGNVKSSDCKRLPTKAVGAFCRLPLLPSPRGLLTAATALNPEPALPESLPVAVSFRLSS